jgi:DNA-directed RNA polymerase subunit RPC12/RpoP
MSDDGCREILVHDMIPATCARPAGHTGHHSVQWNEDDERAAALPAKTHSDHDAIACPVCGAKITDLHEYGSGGDEDGMEIECDACETSLLLTRVVSVDYWATVDPS